MVLTLAAISAGYGAQPVLHDIALTAHGGEVLVLLGANGAGKSTLLRVMSGTLPLKTGSLILHAPDHSSADLSKLNTRQRAQTIAVVPQGVRLPAAFTAHEVVLAGRTPYLPLLGHESAHDLQIVQSVMQQTDTLQFAERRVGELSGGEQQRILLARALAQQPKVLLLDEATAHLDLKHQAEALHLARQWAQGCKLIVIAAMHDLNLAARYADRIALMHAGRLLIVGAPADVLTTAWLQQAYDLPVIISQHPVHQTPLVLLP